MKNFTRIAAVTFAALAMTANLNAQNAKTWDFTQMSDADKEAFEANIAKGDEWMVDGNWWYNMKAIGQNCKDSVAYADLYQLTATKPLYIDQKDKTEPEYTKGLHFGIMVKNGKDSIWTKAIYKNFKIQSDNPRIYLASRDAIIVIPALTAGDSVEVTMAGNSSTEARFLTSMNLTPAFKAQESNFNMKFLRKAKVEKDGNVVLRTNGGCYVYDITVKDKDGNVKTKEEIVDNATNVNTGIKGITAPRTSLQAADEGVYDLNGRHLGNDLNQLPKGVYIVNGKKVLK